MEVHAQLIPYRKCIRRGNKPRSVALSEAQTKSLIAMLERVKWKPSHRKGVGNMPESLTYFSGEIIEYLGKLLDLPRTKDTVPAVTLNRLRSSSQWNKIASHHDSNKSMSWTCALGDYKGGKLI